MVGAICGRNGSHHRPGAGSPTKLFAKETHQTNGGSMKFTLTRAILRDALQGLGRIVSTKATLPILQCIRFDADGDQVAIAGTKLDQY
ncbi:MAG: hypothetical protein FJ280_23085, partial [Planctomycetes bacterium]|nr:hypothetical protein [Planctomycetota bacterium]